MLKRICFLLILLSLGIAYATPIEITPVKKISTATKHFTVGNKYNFKDTKTGDIYTGEIIYYRPNGMTGQEAQVEIGNFVDSKGNSVSGKITVIPSNHKMFQEYSNYFVGTCSSWIRGSEVILRPNEHKFLINTKSASSQIFVIKLIPAYPISTVHDEWEIGDIIEFKTEDDIIKNGQTYIKKGTPVFAKIDYLEENGWIGDNATITMKDFSTINVSGEKIELTSELTINGFELLKYKSKRFAQFFNYISSIFRGKEIDIKSYDTNITFVIVVNE